MLMSDTSIRSADLHRHHGWSCRPFFPQNHTVNKPKPNAGCSWRNCWTADYACAEITCTQTCLWKSTTSCSNPHTIAYHVSRRRSPPSSTAESRSVGVNCLSKTIDAVIWTLLSCNPHYRSGTGHQKSVQSHIIHWITERYTRNMAEGFKHTFSLHSLILNEIFHQRLF